MRGVFEWVESNAADPIGYEPGVLPGGQVRITGSENKGKGNKRLEIVLL